MDAQPNMVERTADIVTDLGYNVSKVKRSAEEIATQLREALERLTPSGSLLGSVERVTRRYPLPALALMFVLGAAVGRRRRRR
jgi:hypothetical protein